MSLSTQSYSCFPQGNFSQGALCVQRPFGSLEPELCDAGLRINYSLPGNRLVQNVDGSIGVVPKNIAKVFGERVWQPIWRSVTSIGWKWESFGALKDGLVAFDKLVTRMFTIFPGADAAVTTTSDLAALSDNSHVVPFDRFVATLSVKDLPSISGDALFQKNYQDALVIKEELEKFVDDIVCAHASFEAELGNYAQAYESLFEKMNEILADVMTHPYESLYSPFQKAEIVLVFPTCIVSPTPTAAKGLSITVTKGGLFRNGEQQSLPKREQFPSGLLKSALIKKVLEGADVGMAIMTTDFAAKPASVKEFKALFASVNIENMRTFVNRKKASITSWIKNRQSFITSVFNTNQNEVHSLIEKLIHDIYTHQAQIVDEYSKQTGKVHKAKRTDDRQQALTSEWSIIEERRGVVWNSFDTRFTFRVSRMLPQGRSNEL